MSNTRYSPMNGFIRTCDICRKMWTKKFLCRRCSRTCCYENCRAKIPFLGDESKICTKCSQEDANTEECPICFLAMNDVNRVKPSECNHTFHLYCLGQWALNTPRKYQVIRGRHVEIPQKPTCPLCRREFLIYQAVSVNKA